MENQVLNNSRPHYAGAGGREDCWSEGATETLVEAWGDRFLKLNRGNLRQNDWKEVADAVNSRKNGVKPSRTGVQCKNRIDTLKKKYKLEKAKPSSSKWPFYCRLDYLIGSSNLTPPSNKRTACGVATTSPSMNKPGFLTFAVKSSKLKVNSNSNQNPNSSGLIHSRLNSSESSLGGGGGGGGDGRGGGGDDDDDVLCGGAARRHTMDYVDFSEETAYKELARAILRFGEIYERIESAKQEQMMELEKQRMEFTRELECQRMNMFMDAQLELEKMKRPARHTSGAGRKL